MKTWQRHPFGVEAFFRRSLVITYAVPQSQLRGILGPGLTLDTYDDWGFVAIAMVQTAELRPRGFPRWLGRDFFLCGYRIFARFVRPGQPTLRGLKILRSDTDRRSMVWLGNLFTHYRYHPAKVVFTTDDQCFEVDVRSEGADLTVRADLRIQELPPGSPFRSLADARRFAGPLPFTFSYDGDRDQMMVVKGVRTAWAPQPVHVEVQRSSFLEAFAGARLANAFYVENVPYAWKPGVLEAVA